MDRADVRRQWDAIAETYARRRDASGTDAALLDELRESLRPDSLVLDIGCGDGARTLANLPEGAIGLDVSRRGLELATAAVPDARLVQGDMVSIPLEDASVDAITAYHAVFHVSRERHPEVYREFARVLKPDGRLLLTLPGGRFETVRTGWMGGRMLFSTPGRDRTIEQVRDAGFGDLQPRVVDDPLGSESEFVFATRE